jgi:hypothetical protein
MPVHYLQLPGGRGRARAGVRQRHSGKSFYFFGNLVSVLRPVTVVDPSTLC